MRIYFSGIGGVGIGPLAEIAIDAGYDVIGSELNSSLMTQALEKRGITISQDQSGEFLRQEYEKDALDWYVYTAALPRDHPELVTARELGIRTAKRDELLAHIIKEKQLKLIAVAGTHGKTTTTGMMIWTLQQLDIPVSYSVGTTLSWGPSGKFDPASKYFVYECDEFDKNFLHFYPHLSLVTSIDYDHPDTYPTEADYKSAFRQFIHQSSSAILWQKDANYINSDDSPNAWSLRESEVFALALAGEHNRRNGTLVLKALEKLAVGENSSNQQKLELFPGTNRRFEKLDDNLYSDYGHHPAEISATLQMAKEIAETVVLVYQPHQNVRQHEISAQYNDEVFKDADEIYWLPTYLSRENPNLEVLSPSHLTKNLSNVHIAVLDDNLWKVIEAARSKGSLVLMMGAGTIDSWTRKQLR